MFLFTKSIADHGWQTSAGRRKLNLNQFLKTVAAIAIGVIIAFFVIKEYMAYRFAAAMEHAAEEMEARRGINR
jgi:hypothetical protein